ncbi:hypothetical protein Cgig2_013017 [Carnegiea gigantea]|uniref:Protein ENHANCED DISEASE RESISTANCE 2 C-terminal domain-containing protein n=1 Tax=Carnegiea gigantea TaxID=171969 RepID=A0A9Q1GNY8_9CARY|nr:hypothetical protein Cgig2_013017 [Carnegiea gigantea]
MGACVSTKKGCVGSRPKKAKKAAQHSTGNRKRRKVIKKRVSSRLSDRSVDGCNSNNRLDNRSFVSLDLTFLVPTGSVEEAWYDSITIFESDGEEEFQSVQDDIVSQGGFERTSMGRHSHEVGSARNSVSELGRNSTEAKHPVFLDEISSSVDGSAGKEERTLDNCGILHNNCLPCLNTNTAPSIEKRRSLSSSPPISSKTLLQRPKAGSQVPFCPLDKKIMDSWSHLEPNTFKVRGKNYFRDKKKDFAPNHAAYVPFGVDVFLSSRKIEHIARFVELPAANSSNGFPPILVVNAQIPLYPAALFQSEADGEGINIVMYYKINDSFTKELPSSFQEGIRKLMHDEVEKVKGFPMDTIVPFRERLKIMGRLVNVEDLHLSSAEKKLLNAYNEKPVLSRPQHEFYSVR